MDYKIMRVFMVKKIMDITLKWNEKSGVYPVMPTNFNEQQQTVWSLLMSGTGIKGGLSEMEDRAMRNTLSEALGITLPKKTERTLNLEDIPPYVCFTSTVDQSGVLSKDRTFMRKISESWVTENGKVLRTSSFSSKHVRLPTREEVEKLVSNIDDEFLTIIGCGLLTLPKSENIRAFIEGSIIENTRQLEALKPSISLSADEITMYSLGEEINPNVVKFVAFMTGKVWNVEDYEKLGDLKITPEIKPLTCVKVNGELRVYVSPATYVDAKSTLASAEVAARWMDISIPTEDEIKSFSSEISLNYLFPLLSLEQREELLKEVKLE